MTEQLKKIFPGAQDFLPIKGTDYVEFYVGNAKQAAHFYKTAFGFQSLAYSGLETGDSTKTSYVLFQDKIRIVLTTPMSGNTEIEEHITKHGDGVKVVIGTMKPLHKMRLRISFADVVQRRHASIPRRAQIPSARRAAFQ